MSSLAALQRRALFLAPIFARGALPAHAPRFAAADDELRGLLAHLHVGGVGRWWFACICVGVGR